MTCWMVNERILYQNIKIVLLEIVKGGLWVPMHNNKKIKLEVIESQALVKRRKIFVAHIELAVKFDFRFIL